MLGRWLGRSLALMTLTVVVLWSLPAATPLARLAPQIMDVSPWSGKSLSRRGSISPIKGIDWPASPTQSGLLDNEGMVLAAALTELVGARPEPCHLTTASAEPATGTDDGIMPSWHALDGWLTTVTVACVRTDHALLGSLDRVTMTVAQFETVAGAEAAFDAVIAQQRQVTRGLEAPELAEVQRQWPGYSECWPNCTATVLPGLDTMQLTYQANDRAGSWRGRYRLIFQAHHRMGWVTADGLADPATVHAAVMVAQVVFDHLLGDQRGSVPCRPLDFASDRCR